MGEASAAETLIAYWPLALPAAVLLTLLAVLIVSLKRRRKTKGSHARPLSLAEIEPMSRDPDQTRDSRNAADGDDTALVEARPAASGAAYDAAADRPGARGEAAVQPGKKVEQQRFSIPSQAQAVAQAHAKAQAQAQASVQPASQAAHQARVPASPPPVADIGAIADQIAAAEAHEGRKGELAALYLELARAYVADQRPDAALGALRSAAGCGAMHGPPAVHAEARLALGELAFSAGDRTGACEQWQIAKTVFHNHGMRDAYGKVDARMRANGCPTDWVLTEF